MSEDAGAARPPDHQDPTPPDVAVTLEPADAQTAPEPAGSQGSGGTRATPTDDPAEPDGHPT